MGGGSSPRISAWALALPVLAGVAALLPALGAGFVHDDHPQILQNPLLRDLAGLPALWTTGVWAGAGSGSSFYRPLMMTSFALDHALFGFSAPALHAVQLALWAGVIALAVALVRQVGGSRATAALSGLIFAVHPLNVEPAVWISARCELWAAAGGLAASLLHWRGLRASREGAATLAFAAAGVAFALGLFGKENALGYGAVLLAMDACVGARFGPRALVRRYGVLALGVALYAGLRSVALGDVSGGILGGASPAALLGASGQGVARVLWPVGLGMSPPAPGAAAAWLGAAVWLAALAAGARAIRRRSVWLVPLALGASQLAIAALAAVRIGELADRYLLGVVLALAWLLVQGVSARPALGPTRARVVWGAATGLLAILSWRHAGVFSSDERLWSHAWRQNPASLRAAINLSAVHLARDDPEGALPWLERAAALDPDDRQVVLNRAAAEVQLGHPERARRLLGTLMARDPRDAEAALRLGHLALERGDASAAAYHYGIAVAGLPRNAEAWAGLGVALVGQGGGAEAEAALVRALALDPDLEQAPALRAMLGRLRSRAAGGPPR